MEFMPMTILPHIAYRPYRERICAFIVAILMKEILNQKSIVNCSMSLNAYFL